MTKENEIYKCEICGNIVSMIETGPGELMCCGQAMDLFRENTAAEEGKEKHVPMLEKTAEGLVVKVGSVDHPMTKEHYIQLIQVMKDDEIVINRKLKPGDEPRISLGCMAGGSGLKARALCNVHGLWISE